MSNEFLDRMMAEKASEVQSRWTTQVSVKDNAVAVEFLTNAVDELIKYVEQSFSISGEEKKEMILNVFGGIYDTVVVGLLPFWLRPFSGTIRKFVVETVANVLIDFIVAKYNASEWTR